eukprot:CAMPEP_0195285090 /NCGR_PEP_ID=MMETSP0707-20130614/3046_1 /TAXON_ID=33640 /ORGANISM="Asterionellopsis glacialis, Strain CCMP134" /LENGTH=452 /DNA_ID=CAMNT_0040344523 /DNA_START=6 /DNA_END=1364 /DNA_ORIENTATION=+
MSSETSSNPERILSSFASLLSSALTLGPDSKGAKPLGDSASTLPCFISPHATHDKVCCCLPSLKLKHPDKPKQKGGSLEEKAALNLARPLALRRNELEAAPMVLLANICESFMTLVDSRFRSSFSALVRQARKQSDPRLSKVLVGLLSAVKQPISATTIVTSFRVLPVSERSPRGDYILPIVMEAVVDLSVLGELVPVTIVAPGTIQGAVGISQGDDMLTQVELVLDTVAFLQSMMKHARQAVRKCVAVSTNAATSLLSAMTQIHKSKDLTEDMKARKIEASRIPSKPSREEVVSEESSSSSQSNTIIDENTTSSSGSEASAPLDSSGDAKEKTCSLMPPPPRRASRLSLGDLRRISSARNTGESPTSSSESKNASWDATPSKKFSGLTMLNTAAGLKRSHQNFTGDDEKRESTASNKKIRFDTNIPVEASSNLTERRKTFSCPSLVPKTES